MMLIAASCPSKSAAALSTRIGRDGTCKAGELMMSPRSDQSDY
jgi:hypothetical protein